MIILFSMILGVFQFQKFVGTWLRRDGKYGQENKYIDKHENKCEMKLESEVISNDG